MRSRMMPLALAVVIAVGLWLRAAAELEAGGGCTVPKSWGRAVAISEGSMLTQVAFEDADGVVRIVVANCKPGKAVHTIGRTDD